MSTNNPSPILTNHAMLVAWGIYARQIGLVEAIEAVRLHQKKREHRPQTKVIEFLVAILAGRPRSGGGRGLAATRLGRLQWGQPHPEQFDPSGS